MADFTEVTSRSWISRIGKSIVGVLIGLVLFLVAFPLLFWNEGRAVERYKTLQEGGGVVVTVPAERVDPANSGKLVHVTGRADTEETLSDSVFGVSVHALKLKRIVEMYQWEEDEERKTRKKVGGGTETVTSYSYQKTWSTRVIDSGDFKQRSGHENPGAMPWDSSQWVASEVTLGEFRMSPSLVGKIGSWERVSVNDTGRLPPTLTGRAALHDGGFYVGADPYSPQIGDVRVTFREVQPTDVSVIAAQVGGSFEPYRAEAGGTIELLQTGIHSSEAMIQKAIQSNKILTWILRGVGFLIMFIGLGMIFKPLSVLADVLPFLGNLAGAGTGLVAFVLAAALSAVTIGIAWLFYRPLLGISLLVVATLLVFGVLRLLRKGKKKAAAPPPPPPPPVPPPVPDEG
jgi:hypothetical protein